MKTVLRKNIILTGHSRVAFCPFVKTKSLCGHSYGNVFRQHVPHFHANQTHFHVKGFGRRLVFKQRHKVTRLSINVNFMRALGTYCLLCIVDLVMRSSKFLVVQPLLNGTSSLSW